MNPAKGPQVWVSAHLYFTGGIYGSHGDRVVAGVVEPFVMRALRERWIDRFFFVRYADPGSHVRLRVRGIPEILEETVRPALVAHVRTVWPVQDVSVAHDAPATSETTAAADALRWVPYTAETDRYGGTDAVEVAEACFEASSRAAFALLHKFDQGEHSARLGKALLAMLVLLHVFTRDRTHASTFAHWYRTANLSGFAREEGQELRWHDAFDAGFSRQADSLSAFVDEAWESLDRGHALPRELDLYREDLNGVRDDLERLCAAGRLRQYGRSLPKIDQAFQSIVPSYMHMMNNRLGVALPDEAYLAHLIGRSLEAHVGARFG